MGFEIMGSKVGLLNNRGRKIHTVKKIIGTQGVQCIPWTFSQLLLLWEG